MFESLESRTLMSVSLDDGVVTVKGTSGNDTIMVGNLAGNVQVFVNFQLKKEYKPSRVDKIVAKGLGGDDAISSFPGSAIRCVFYGGKGHDSLLGGFGNDLLYGGPGTDSLVGNHGKDKLWGQSGTDGLTGGDGKDELYGGDGIDNLWNDGVDKLVGGAGKDIISDANLVPSF